MKKKLVLVVDDDPAILKLIKTLIQDDVTEVVVTDEISHAIFLINKYEINLLIADYSLMNEDGWNLVAIIKEKELQIPIVIISGHIEKETKIKSLGTGANIFIEKPFGVELNSVVKNFLNLFENNKLESAADMIKALSTAVEKRDSYIQGHHHRVMSYSLKIYDELGYNNNNERENLRIGCMLHDIGKIGIPDEILKSTKTLTNYEREIIQHHPEIGLQICSDLNSLKGCLDIIKHHHEKLDGTGYPDRLTNNKISDIVAITTVADIYDALTSDRVYRAKNSTKEALEIMKREVNERKIDNKIFTTLIKLISRHPKEFPK